jgi:TrmH family RNA methyltransferase
MISKNQIKHIRQLEQKKYRQREGLFVAEGPKVVGDLMAHSQPVAVFATEDYTPPRPTDIQRISGDELRKISFLQHPQQVVALFPLPQPQPYKPSPSALTIALDGVQDPGNLGTIIRLADWFGIDTIFCSEGTVDAWNPKVIQATMGSIARVNMIYTDSTEFFNSLPSDYPIYGTFLDGQNIYAQQLSQHGVIVMGNEGNGISDTVRAHVTHKLLIPDFHNGNTADSLNVAIATAITCSEFCRRRL